MIRVFPAVLAALVLALVAVPAGACDHDNAGNGNEINLQVRLDGAQAARVQRVGRADVLRVEVDARQQVRRVQRVGRCGGNGNATNVTLRVRR